MTKEEIKKIIKEEKISFIQCWFTDILGNLKSFTITPSEIDEALEEGMGFDGSSISGFNKIEESDMIAKPDPKTFAILPWKNEENRTARMFCDILNPDGTPFEGDPRYILRKITKEAARLGYTFYVGPELEFFYIKDPRKASIIDECGYFDGLPLDLGEEVREKTVQALESLGIKVEYTHHEVAPSQHEIDLRYDEALTMADKVMTYKVTVKEIARRHELYATFMPKPIQGENGSGMHTHQSLFLDKKNAFFDSGDKYHLSDIAKYYIAGIFKHIGAITAICNQWVNSYKRLVPGYEAPVYVAWAQRNRSALVRVPMYKPGKERATRIELRSPDPASNPYLAFAVMLGAGLDGIKSKYSLSEPIEENIFKMSSTKKNSLGISSLPADLGEAIKELEKSELAKRILGDHIWSEFLESKKTEWDKFRLSVSDFELKKYLPTL